MIVVYRNGERRVITGWREWLVWLALALSIVVIGCVMFGIALTLFTIALLTLPVAIALALIAKLVQSRQ